MDEHRLAAGWRQRTELCHPAKVVESQRANPGYMGENIARYLSIGRENHSNGPMRPSRRLKELPIRFMPLKGGPKELPLAFQHLYPKSLLMQTT